MMTTARNSGESPSILVCRVPDSIITACGQGDNMPTDFLRSQLLCRLVLWALRFSVTAQNGRRLKFPLLFSLTLLSAADGGKFCEWSVNHCTRYQLRHFKLLNWLEKPLQCTDNAVGSGFVIIWHPRRCLLLCSSLRYMTLFFESYISSSMTTTRLSVIAERKLSGMQQCFVYLQRNPF